MQVTSFITLVVTLITAAVTTMPTIIKFAPTPDYFGRVEDANGVYPASFPSGPAGMSLKDTKILVKFSGRLFDLTSLLYTVSELIELADPNGSLAIDHNFRARHLITYMNGIMMEEPRRT